MTRCLLAITLTLTPAPLTAPKETPHQWPTPAFEERAAFVEAPMMLSASDWDHPLDSAPSPPTTVEASVPVGTDAIPPPPLPPTPIEAGMNRLAELGATDWQLRTFGCLAWYESRNDPYAVSPTGDYGIFQINRYYHAWRWAGRDIYDPTVNAEVAWDIYRESGWRAWTTARLCGV